MVTTTEASVEEDDPEVSTMTMEASIEESEDTIRLSELVNVYDNWGAAVFTVSPRSQQQQWRRQLRKHKIQRFWVNVSDGRGTYVFTGRGYWQRRRRRRKSKTSQRNQQRWQRASAEDEGYMTRPRDLIQQRRWWGIDYGPKGSTTTTDAMKEEDEHKYYNNDSRCVDGG